MFQTLPTNRAFPLAHERAAHPLTQPRVFGEASDSLGQFAAIECLGDKAISAMLDEISGAAHVRDNHRQSAGLCFKDDVPESIRRARKNEEIRRSIGIRQLLTAQIAGKQRVG